MYFSAQINRLQHPFGLILLRPAMREVTFVRKNADAWETFEARLREENPDPDELAELYVRVTDDLAVARTHFPESDTARYLNDLATEVHQEVYRDRREDRSRFKRFWAEEVPQAVYQARTEMIVSAMVFWVAVGIGAVSAAHDADFVRLILGDQYVNMTLANINRGDPMAVYKSAHQTEMTLGIAINNVRVSFFAFAAGLLLSFGTGYVLLQNGIMLGSFHYLFYENDLLLDSLLVVYIHGTLEICAIVIAGGAGLVLGNGILFPGTLPRRTALMQAARRGGTIVLGLVPVFLMAAVLEGFVTRYTHMPAVLSLLIIAGSAAFIVWYFALRAWTVGTEGAEGESRKWGRAEARQTGFAPDDE